MAKVSLQDVGSLRNEQTAVARLNANFAAIEDAFDNTLSLNGQAPNSFQANVDANSYRIQNLPEAVGPTEPLRKQEFDAALDGILVGVTGPEGPQGPPGPEGAASTVPGPTGPAGANGTNGTNGVDGNDGWSPVLAVVSDGTRRVHQVVDWTGGTGTKPATGSYLSSSGFTGTIGSATDIRGAQGTSGAGTGDLLSTNNLSDVGNTATARTNLGLAIGTNVQAYDAELAALAGLTSAANKVPYFTGSGTAALADFSAAGQALVDDADATAQRVTLGLVIGTNVPAPTGTGASGTWGISITGNAATATSATTAGSATTATTAGNVSGTVAVANGGTGATTAATARSNLGLVIGTDVQAYDADLSTIAGMTPTKGNIIVGDGTTWVPVGVGTNGQALVADSAEASGVKWSTVSGGGGAWTTLFKASSQTRQSSTTYTDDAELQFSVTSGQTLVFRAVYFVSHGAGGFLIGCNGPSASSIRTNDYTFAGAKVSGTAYNTPITSSTGSTYNPGIGEVFGKVVFTASGTFAMRLAQVSSNAAATIFEAGSYIEYKLI